MNNQYPCLRNIIYEINKKVRHPMAEIAVNVRLMQKGDFEKAELQKRSQKILENLVASDVALANILHPYDDLLEELPVIKALSEQL